MSIGRVGTLALGAILATGCSDQTTGPSDDEEASSELVRHPPTGGVVLDALESGSPVDLKTINGEGDAAWSTAAGMYYARGDSIVRLPLIDDFPFGRVFLHADGSALLDASAGKVAVWRDGRLTLLYPSGEGGQGNLAPLGFTEDGRAWVRDDELGLLFWAGELEASDRPAAALIALDGTLLIDRVGTGDTCILDRAGEQVSLTRVGQGECRAVDVASEGAALVMFDRVAHIWDGTDLVSVDEFAWEIGKPEDAEELRLFHLNRHGEAVGAFRDVPVIVRDGTIQTINALDNPGDGWVWLMVGDINDRGQALVVGRNDWGEAAVVRLELGR